MRIRRRLPILFGVLLVAAAVALGVFLRKHAPPEPARLLPGADGFAYINLKWIRRANLGGQLPQVSHDPEYEEFIQATGFQFERDLDQAAVAIHNPSSLPSAPGEVPQGPRYSEIFVGKIDGERLRAYLRKLSTATEADGSVDIYSIPLDGRTVRVAILNPDTVAASNHPDPQVIRSIVERSRKLASPFGGPALLRQYYKDVPLASLAWGILKVDPTTPRVAATPLDFAMFFSQPAVLVFSGRYLGSIHLRAEAYTASVEEAQRLTEQLSAFLSLFHAAEGTVSPQGPDPDVKKFFESLQVQRHGDRAVLTAVVPPGFIHKAVAENPVTEVPKAPEPPPAKGKPARK